MVLAQIDPASRWSSGDRVNGDKPIQYILGGAEFYGLWFEVTTDTFIPRPETEVLVEYIIQNYKDGDIRIIDLGTGCGNIAITLSKHLKAKVYAIDVSIKALEVAKRNAVKHGVWDRIEFCCSDWFTPLEIKEATPNEDVRMERSNKLYSSFIDDLRSPYGDLSLTGFNGLRIAPVNLIVSNPPYIASEEWDFLPSNVRDYEPKIALWGGEKGLEHYKSIVSFADRFLIPRGELVLEIGWNQGKLVKDLIEKTGDFMDVKVMKDHENRDRVVIGRNCTK